MKKIIGSIGVIILVLVVAIGTLTTKNIEETTFKFREKASIEIPEMIQNNKPIGKVVKNQKRVVVGC